MNSKDTFLVSDNDASGNPDLIHRIALVTRTLRQSMRELGLDTAIKDAAHAIPDARDRLHYVASMTEQAANRVLNAAERTMPLQDQLRRDAEGLAMRWQNWFETPLDIPEARLIVDDTCTLLADVPGKVQETQDLLREIILAQDFQDLTGQVITKMLGVMATLETELVQVLIDSVPQERRDEAFSRLNGPGRGHEQKKDIVTGQDQVDELLASLGL
ncbi:protein phosphatase CheZ [Allopusillimonas ginsengisoli]|uniref:protein phosphatase CheZ n=1 Tax=Allopusillimonas ginsengisoli TaxID=453575 RepID=UPI001020048C|nr:protein phosphatase CheZ [Allopusillimonas ginsengisoli]TEA79422.1 protein phosphatase CheZ [Allopusillimonas ginsengisoli]